MFTKDKMLKKFEKEICAQLQLKFNVSWLSLNLSELKFNHVSLFSDSDHTWNDEKL